MSYTITVHCPVPADCINKVISQNGGRRLFERLSTQRPAPKITLKNNWHSQQQQSISEDTHTHKHTNTHTTTHTTTHTHKHPLTTTHTHKHPLTNTHPHAHTPTHTHPHTTHPTHPTHTHHHTDTTQTTHRQHTDNTQTTHRQHTDNTQTTHNTHNTTTQQHNNTTTQQHRTHTTQHKTQSHSSPSGGTPPLRGGGDSTPSHTSAACKTAVSETSSTSPLSPYSSQQSDGYRGVEKLTFQCENLKEEPRQFLQRKQSQKPCQTKTKNNPGFETQSLQIRRLRLEIDLAHFVHKLRRFIRRLHPESASTPKVPLSLSKERVQGGCRVCRGSRAVQAPAAASVHDDVFLDPKKHHEQTLHGDVANLDVKTWPEKYCVDWDAADGRR